MDEAYLQIVNFANSVEQDPTVIAEQGTVLVEMVTSRLGTIHEAEGMSHFCLGGLIKKIREHHSWKLFDGVEEHWVFGDFCKQKLGLSHGKAMGLLRVWEQSQAVGMTADEIDAVGGWSVAYEILKLAKNHNDVILMIEKFKQAESRNAFVRQLKEEGIAGIVAAPHPRKKKVLFKVDENEEQFMQESLERAAIQMGGELNKDTTPDRALLFIVTEWRQLREKTE